MRRRKAFLIMMSVLSSVALIGCTSHREVDTSVDIEQAKEHLTIVSGARILLGHQSVGRDVLAGLRSLAEETGVDLRIERINGVPPDDQPGLFHSEIGENGDPDGKCEAFAQLLTRPEQPKYDLAMMKFCYADLGRDPSIEVEGMLKRYTTLVSNLRQQRPDVELLHISLPLKAEPLGKKTRLKRLLGMEVSGDYANALRNEFNEGLRAQFSHEPFFDLAALESTYADGSRKTYSYEGETYYMLANEYTHDGGHLNPPAQRMAAAEFLRVLATTLRDRQAEQLTHAGAAAQSGTGE